MNATAERPASWKWLVCGLMLLATMLNYMDRMALSQQASQINRDLELSKEQYGQLEKGFGYAFAFGAVLLGLVVDYVGARRMYPAVLLAWSTAGFLTSFATSFESLWYCRVALGFFESGQWPCALKVAQRILLPQDRSLGNSVLQSGASLGAIATPPVVLLLSDGAPFEWRLPFQVIGLLGLLWIGPWLWFVRSSDLAPLPADADPRTADRPRPGSLKATTAGEAASVASGSRQASWARRFAVAVVIVCTINLCWHFFRVWQPLFLEEYHHYTFAQVQTFTIAYYLATDVGCLSAGAMVRHLVRRQLPLDRARKLVFAACCLLTSMSVLAAWLPRGPGLLIALCLVGAGSLGLFPIYYSLTQELSHRYQGVVTGVLGFITWGVSSEMHPLFGRLVDETGSYSQGLLVVGLMPMIGLAALLLAWRSPRNEATAEVLPGPQEPQPETAHKPATAEQGG